MERKRDTTRLTRSWPRGPCRSASSNKQRSVHRLPALCHRPVTLSRGACSDRDLKRNTYAGHWLLAIPVHAHLLVAAAPTNDFATWGETATVGLCPRRRRQPRPLQRRRNEGAARGGGQTPHPAGAHHAPLPYGPPPPQTPPL